MTAARIRMLRRGGLAAATVLLLTGGAQATGGDTTATDPAGAPPQMQAGSYLAGRFATTVSDFTAAAAYIGQALASDPDNLELLQRAYYLLTGEGRIDEALDVARRLEKVEGSAASAGVLLSLDALQRGDYAAAERYADEIAPGGADKFVAPILKAWIKLAAGDLDMALASISALERIEGFGPVFYMQRGMIYERAGRLAEAEQDYVKAVETAGETPLRLVEVLGNLYARTGRPEEARKVYQRFLDNNPDSVAIRPLIDALAGATPPAPVIRSAEDGLAEAMFSLGTILLQEESNDMALVFVRLALELRPDHLMAQVLLGDVLRAQERFEPAIAAYRAVPADSAYSWPARLSVADALDRMGKSDEAEAMLRTMIDERPDSPDAANLLGNLLRAKERFAEAAAAYDIAVARLGTIKPRQWSLLYFRGICYERSDQWEKAEADFRKALELEPDQPFVLNYLAYSWVEKGQHYDQSLDMLQNAVRQRPNDGYIVDSLGWVFYRLGRYKEAVEQLERAVQLKPLDPVLNDHLGDAYWRVGRKVEARYQWKRALQFKPEADQVGLIEDKLEKGLITTGEAPGSGG